MLETSAELTCPYCGEPITLILDLSVEEQTYIEDCSVCCQPMTVSYTASNGELTGVQVAVRVYPEGHALKGKGQRGGPGKGERKRCRRSW